MIMRLGLLFMGMFGFFLVIVVIVAIRAMIMGMLKAHVSIRLLVLPKIKALWQLWANKGIFIIVVVVISVIIIVISVAVRVLEADVFVFSLLLLSKLKVVR